MSEQLLPTSEGLVGQAVCGLSDFLSKSVEFGQIVATFFRWFFLVRQGGGRRKKTLIAQI